MEESKTAYDCLLNTAKTSSSLNTVCTEDEVNKNTKIERLESSGNMPEEDLNNLEDDIDFLLSLDEPVQKNLPKITQTFNMPSTSMCSNNGKILKEISTFISYQYSFNILLYVIKTYCRF